MTCRARRLRFRRWPCTLRLARGVALANVVLEAEAGPWLDASPSACRERWPSVVAAWVAAGRPW